MDLGRQLRSHLELLKAGGVEYVPRGEPITLPPPVAMPTSPTFAEPVAPIADGIEARRVELVVLAKQVEKCNRCPELFSTRTQTVFGVGKLDPEICFVGEAPGADEDTRGEPFVGRSGQLLNKIIAACGFQREEVYICNTIKCRPPNNRTPTPQERDCCREYFDKQIALVNPKYIVCLGATAAQNVLGTTTTIGRLRGSMHKLGDIPVLCTFHPSYLLRDESKKRDCWEDMKMLLGVMGRPVPARS